MSSSKRDKGLHAILRYMCMLRYLKYFKKNSRFILQKFPSSQVPFYSARFCFGVWVWGWWWCEKMKGNGMNKIKTYHVVTEEAGAERKWKCLHKNDITHYLALLFMDLLESPFPFSSLDTISLFLVHNEDYDVCIWVLYVHKSNYDSSLHIHTYKCELRFLLTPPHCNITTHTKSPSNYYPAWLCLACKWNEKREKFFLIFIQITIEMERTIERDLEKCKCARIR